MLLAYAKYEITRHGWLELAITGIGVDIVEIKRIEEIFERERAFAEKIFTKLELKYCLSRNSCYIHLAGRFAAKEAVAKALGGSFPWKSVEIISDKSGRPLVKLKGRARGLAIGSNVHVSISHSRNYAVATAIIEEYEDDY